MFKLDIFQLRRNKCCSILVIIIDNIFEVENDIFNSCFHIASDLLFFYKIVCCINFTTFSYSFKYCFINFVILLSTWRDLMFNINASIFSLFQYFFIMRILFSSFFCLCCAFNIMMIKFCHSDLCRITIENCKLCWICCINSTTKSFNIFCCLNIKFLTTFNLRN